MALQTSVPIRLTIAGDGESTELSLDLKKIPVQQMNAHYELIPSIPDSIISLSIGGPGISPEEPRMSNFVTAELDGPLLKLHFSVPPLKDKEHYTLEFIFGYNGIDNGIESTTE